MRVWAGTILGEPASKSNSSQIVKIGGRFSLIKSAKARAYVKAVHAQVPVLKRPLGGRLALTLTIFYASERPDLDESLIMDALQGRIYENDRQVRWKQVAHAIDRKNPRAEVRVEEMDVPLLEPARDVARVRAAICAEIDRQNGTAGWSLPFDLDKIAKVAAIEARAR